MKKVLVSILVIGCLNIGILSVAASPLEIDPATRGGQSVCKVEVEASGVLGLFQAIKGVIIHLLDGGDKTCGMPEPSKSKFGVIIH